MAPNIMNQSLKNRSKKWKRMKIFAISFFILIQLNITSTFAKGIPILRDDEIENILYQATGPLFKAANLNPKSVKLYLSGFKLHSSTRHTTGRADQAQVMKKSKRFYNAE